MNDALVIAGKSFQSRLIVGTGKYKDVAETEAAIDASGAELPLEPKGWDHFAAR